MSQPTKPNRDQSIELLRLIAIFGVVAFHVGTVFSDIAYAGLIVFVILSPYVDLAYGWNKTRTIMALAKSLLLPWALWFLAYGALNILAHKPALPNGFGIGSVLAGTSIHLWFLPAIFIVLVILNILKKHANPPLLFWVSLVITAVSLLTFPIWRPVLDPGFPPYAQWLHAAPAVFIGMALGLVNHVKHGKLIANVTLLISAAVLLTYNLPGVSITYGVATIATIAVVQFGARIMPNRWNVQSLASCTLGIYLTHMFWVRIFNRITGPETFATAIGAFVLALGSVWIARKFMPKAKLLLG